MNANPIYAIKQADGSERTWSTNDIRDLIAEGPEPVEDGWRCRVCGHEAETAQAMGPHTAVHKRLIGDLPPHAKTAAAKKKAAAAKKVKAPTKKTVVADTTPVPDRAEMPPLNETLSGVLYGYVGPTIPTSMIAEVGEWFAHSEALINALTRKDMP